MIKGLNEKIADIDRQIGQFPAELRPTAEETRLLQNGRAIAANTAQEEALSQPSGTVLMTNPEILEEEDKEGALVDTPFTSIIVLGLPTYDHL